MNSLTKTAMIYLHFATVQYKNFICSKTKHFPRPGTQVVNDKLQKLHTLGEILSIGRQYTPLFS